MAWFSNLANQAIQFADSLADNIVAEANKAQNEIVAEQNKIKSEEEKKKHNLNSESISLPWETQDESRSIVSQDLMERILSLSLSENNFIQSPNHLDKAVEFDFNEFVPIAMRLLTLDSNLARVHAKLMPKLNEEDFWRHYYFRIQYLRAKLNIDDRKVYEGRFIFSEEEENTIIFPPDVINSINQISHHQPVQQQQQHTTNIDMSSLVTNHCNAITTPTYIKDGERNNNPNVDDDNDKVKGKERPQQQRERRRQQDADLAAEVLAELAGDNSNNGNGSRNTSNNGGTAIHSSSSSSSAGSLAVVTNITTNDHVYAEHNEEDELELSDLDELLKDIIDEDNNEEEEGIIKNNSSNSNGDDDDDDDLDLLEDIINSTSTSK